jgi:hypothetical protein
MPRLIDQLFEDGVIGRRVFSIYISDVLDINLGIPFLDSHIIFGGYNTSKFAESGEEITWTDIETSNYWTLPLSSVKLEFSDNN